MSKPDLDELLKILEENQEKRQAKSEALNEDSTKRFIRKNGLIQGLDRIPNYIIYYTYRTKYKPKMGEEKWSKVHFFRLFNKYFDQARTGKYRFYKLDGKSFDLTREGLLEAKKFDEEYTIQIKKERGTYKKPKRKGKVSLSKSKS
jgi:hypothetical protein